ncbi:MAG: 4-hydroxy-tetrahydrodipicolinate reductase [Alphaproteobacteria bacterium]|nr:4-hydroxy-tetrahydrodipicolinate reductase [Alphaproteobacteria bacterium]
MTIPVLVNGAKGKMGTMTVNAVNADPELTLVGTTDKGDDLVAEIRKSKAKVVVDFTNAVVGHDNFLKIIEAGAHPVMGTSGFKKEQVAQLTELCQRKGIGGLIAPNFAIGAVLMMRFAKEAAPYMDYVEIIESHHEKKLDAPSGTAVRTAELIAEARQAFGVQAPAEKPDAEDARGGLYSSIRIHSVRMPGYVANQRVVFGGTGQTLTIEHNSLDRESFRAGVILAIKKIVGTKDLAYGLEELL